MKVKNFIVAALLAVVGVMGFSNAMVSPVSAKVLCSDGSEKTKLSDCPEWKDGNNGKGIAAQNDLMKTLNTIINVVVGVVGFVAVAMIVMGGISFATSQGDTAKTTKARNTILYGVVGLVVAMLAFAIVNFVLSNVFKAS